MALNILPYINYLVVRVGISWEPSDALKTACFTSFWKDKFKMIQYLTKEQIVWIYLWGGSKLTYKYIANKWKLRMKLR